MESLEIQVEGKPSKSHFNWKILLLSAFAVILGSLALGLALIGHQSMYSNAYGAAQFFTSNFLGIVIMVFVTPLGFVALWQFYYTLISDRSTSRRLMSGVLWACCAFNFALSMVFLIYIVKPYAQQYGMDPADADMLSVFIGVPIFIVFLALSMTSAYLAIRASRFNTRESILKESLLESQQNCDDVNDQSSSNGLVAPLDGGKPATGRKLFVVVGLIVWVICVVMLAITLPPLWNIIPQNYFTQGQSPFSIVSGTTPLSQTFNFQLYPDTVVYFTWLMSIILLGCLSNFVPILHLRILFGKPRDFHPFARGVTLGEILVLCATAGLYGWWFWYWYASNARIAQMDPYQQFARAAGHMANLSTSFLLLPIARNSVWERVFGIPFDRAVKYHRWLGCLTFAWVTAHLITWYAAWSSYGVLANNIATIGNLIMCPLSSAPDMSTLLNNGCVHQDNFTVAIVQLTYVGLIFMVALALFARRKNYELFRYAHYFSMIWLVSALLHSWALWPYVTVGAILYLVDVCLRACRTHSATARLEHACGGITKITLIRPPGCPRHSAGQYAFVNIPTISRTQWHPFTVSSPPHSNEVTFHVKALGTGSWSSNLAKIATTHTDVTVNIDGFYGRIGDVPSHKCLLLVCGGIGATPTHSLLAEIYHRACSQDPKVRATLGSLRHIKFIWTAQSDSTLLSFSNLFYDISRAAQDGGPTFEIVLHSTSADSHVHDGETGFAGTSPVAARHVLASAKKGTRAPLAQIFKEVSESYPGNQTLAMVCGPSPMIDSVSSLAHDHAMDFHTEVFLF